MPPRPGSLRGDRILGAVVGLAALALAARLLWLGRRPFHWDEARVGYWTLRFLATGSYEYRPVAGGPLLYLAGRQTFTLLGATDATARLPVALVGGLLPLAALTFRSRLDDAETVLLAAVLGFNPLLLSYSRFLRGDVPAAAQDDPRGLRVRGRVPARVAGRRPPRPRPRPPPRATGPGRRARRRAPRPAA